MRLDLRRRRGVCSLLLILCCGSSLSLNQRHGRQNSGEPHSSAVGQCYRETDPFESWVRQRIHVTDVCIYRGDDHVHSSEVSYKENDELHSVPTKHGDEEAATKDITNDDSRSSGPGDGKAYIGKEKLHPTAGARDTDLNSETVSDSGQTSGTGTPGEQPPSGSSGPESPSPPLATASDPGAAPPVTDDPVTDASPPDLTTQQSVLDASPDSEVLPVSDSVANGSGSTVPPDKKQQLLDAAGAASQKSGGALSENQEIRQVDPTASGESELAGIQQRNAANASSLKQNETDNATASILNNSIIDDKEAMPSFDEWKKIRLEQEQLQEVPSQTKAKEPEQREATKPVERKRGRRNYASVECGAKLLSANPGAESASKVLLEAKDEYMLNPCNSLQRDGMWFIVELCENIYPTHIELANFELYSSTGREFAVYMGDPDQSREWTQIGRFEMAQLKTVQSFPLDAPGFGKAIKVEFLSIYENSQYYCPLSLVRVFGSSMVDDYEEKVLEDTTKIDPEPVLRQESVEPTVVASDSANTDGGENMVSRAKQAVINIISSVSQAVSGASTRSAEVNCTDCEGSPGGNESTEPSIVPAVFDSCFDMTNLSGSRGLLWPSMKCHRRPFINEMKNMGSCSYESLRLETKTLSVAHPPLETKSMAPPQAFITSTVADITPTTTTEAMKEVKTKILVPIITPDLQQQPPARPQHPPVPQQQEPNPQPAEQTPKQSEDANEESHSPVQAPQKTPDEQDKRPDPESAGAVSTTPKPPAKTAPQPNLVLTPPILPVPGPKPFGQQGSGPPTTTKENPFNRFESRIKQLELHMNLSGTYLEELSKRYRKQMEEMQAAFNKTVAVLNAESKKGVERDHNQQMALAALQEKLTTAVESVRALEAERDSLWWRLLLVYVALLVASVAILIVLLHIVPRRAIASFMYSDLFETRIRDVVAARERDMLAEQGRSEQVLAPRGTCPGARVSLAVKSEPLDLKDERPGLANEAGDVSKRDVQGVLSQQKIAADQQATTEAIADGAPLYAMAVHVAPTRKSEGDACTWEAGHGGPFTDARLEAGELSSISKKRRRRHRGKASNSTSNSSASPGPRTVYAPYQATTSNCQPALSQQNLFQLLPPHTQDPGVGGGRPISPRAQRPSGPSTSSTSLTHGRRQRATLPAEDVSEVRELHEATEGVGGSGIGNLSSLLGRSL